jgi:purine-binding chemotaxis protein CheW
MENQIVVFELGAEHFGVSIASVESIIKLQSITKMPQAPSFVEGVTNLRGKVLPVLDLRARFGLAKQEPTKSSRIIVISVDKNEIGMVVDGVSEVLTIQNDAVEPAPAITTTLDSTFITGIAKIGQRLVILLDLGKVLSLDEQGSLTQKALQFG